MKIKRRLGRVLSILVLCMLLVWIMASANSISAFNDIPSLLFISIISTAMLVFTNQWTDYIRAIKIAMGAIEFTTKELKASRNAIDLSIKTIYAAGIIGTIVGWVQLVILMSDPKSMTLGMAVGILTLLYALIINMVQYAIKSMITKEIIYRENENTK